MMDSVKDVVVAQPLMLLGHCSESLASTYVIPCKKVFSHNSV